ncbi:fibronectin type III domain-containing protein [Candidatus Poribacteria bacterium]|nr:fibronectin type III domain-containing protein [Candidatus Poribacteria bacterium]
MRNIIQFLLLIIFTFTTVSGFSAVTSVGEVNVEGETKGIVPASSTIPLIVSLTIDRSLAEPGEEIRTIEITMPNGFVTRIGDFKYIHRDGIELIARAVVSGGNVLRIELTDPIVDFQNSLYEIAFDSQTPNNVFEAIFKVLLRNREDGPIGEFIRDGQADGKLNNDDFTLQVIPNVPPAPVTDFSVEADKTGENDVTLTWNKSLDPDVNGYIIYRNKEFTINIEKRSSTTYRDVNVSPGNHTYQITAYKTIFLQSIRSPTQSVEVSVDTAAPEPPTALRIITSNQGVEVFWMGSVTRDVTTYKILFGSAEFENLQTLPDGELSAEKRANESPEYRYIDTQPLEIGSFTYAIVAIDEAGNESSPIKKRYRVFDRPYPNPFTPLSNDPDFNTVIFPARVIEDIDGEFSVLLFNLNGVLIRSLMAQIGETELKWDGKNENGDIVESGIYLYQLQVGDSYKTGTIILAK